MNVENIVYFSSRIEINCQLIHYCLVKIIIYFE
ncbi:hypothetical protein OIU76_009793 [Salix suchowensis]|nr:hypothetical protein OIU76_009793 [Salix suchowensis]